MRKENLFPRRVLLESESETQGKSCPRLHTLDEDSGTPALRRDDAKGTQAMKHTGKIALLAVGLLILTLTTGWDNPKTVLAEPQSPNQIEYACPVNYVPIWQFLDAGTGLYRQPACVNQNGALYLQPDFFGIATSVAMKPVTSNAIQYVTTTGSDANDGLSWGSAKATIQAAVNALPLTPDGSTSGIVYVAAGTYTFSTGIVLPASHAHDSISIIGVPGDGTASPPSSVQGGTILNYTGSGAAITQVIASSANQNDLAGSIENIVVDGANATGSAIGIKFGGMLNMNIRDVSIADFSGTGQVGIQVDNNGTSVFTERYHFPFVSFENDNIGLQFKVENGGNNSFGHSGGNVLYFDEYNGQTGISIVGGTGGASVYDGDWTFEGNFVGTSTFMSIDGTSNFKGHINFLCEAGGSNVTRFSIASGGVIKVFGEFAPTGVFTDSNGNSNGGGLVTNGDNNGNYIQFNQLSSTAPNPATSGDINLENLASIAWRNGANTGDVALSVNSGNNLIYDGNAIATPSGVNLGNHLTQFAASQWAGTLALSSGTATFTFPTAYSSSPVCVATDVTSAAAVKASATTTTLTLTGTGTDGVSFICVGNPN
jgi:hypothetical protein